MPDQDLDYVKIGLCTYNWSVRLAFVIMVAIGLRGLVEIGWGLFISMKGLLSWILHWPIEQGGQTIPAVEGGIGSILDGFEFLLLAPLAFVIVVSVGNYLHALLLQPDADESEHQLHRVKGLIVSLMISIVATDLVKRFVGQAAVQFEPLIFGGSLILLFTLYFILLLKARRIGG